MRRIQAIMRGMASTDSAVTAKAETTPKITASAKLKGSFVWRETAASSAKPAAKTAAWINIQKMLLRLISLCPAIRPQGA